MSYTIAERLTGYDRMLASEGWARVGLLEKTLRSEQEDTSILAQAIAKLSEGDILHHGYEDPELQAEGVPKAVSIYVRTHQKEKAQKIMECFSRHTHTV